MEKTVENPWNKRSRLLLTKKDFQLQNKLKTSELLNKSSLKHNNLLGSNYKKICIK